MAGFEQGAISGGTSTAATGAAAGAAIGSIVPGVGTAVGAVVGGVAGGVFGSVFGGLMGNSASRAKKWQKIANQRMAQYNELQNRRTFLASLRSLRAQRASQLQAQSTDLQNYISGGFGALASIGSQADYNYQQFSMDIFHQNRIQQALNKARSSISAAEKYGNYLQNFNDVVGAFGTAASNISKARKIENLTGLMRGTSGTTQTGNPPMYQYGDGVTYCY